MIRFSKMQGLGNDFAVIDNRRNQFNLESAMIKHMADRHLGIGFDQLLVLTDSPVERANFGYQIFNADGTQVGQCGNGARCLAHFIHDHHISDKPTLIFATNTTTMAVSKVAKGQYRVELPAPIFTPNQIPFETNQTAPPFQLAGFKLNCYVANVGNPHAIIAVDRLDNIDINTQGLAIENHRQFPEKVNVSFMQILSKDEIRLIVWERGAGVTKACGSAACAAMAVARQFLGLRENVTVNLPGGTLTVHWPGGEEKLSLEGPSQHVYEGEWPR